MVKTAILIEKIKQYFLWGGLATLTVPTLPLQAAVALNNSVNTVMSLLRHGGRRVMPEVPSRIMMGEKPEITTLADDHPLRTWADGHARAEGLSAGTSISYDVAAKGSLVRNASVRFEDDKAHIHFVGDPEADDPALVKNIIAHELGHHTAGQNIKFSRYAMNTTSTYAVMAEMGGVGALLLHGLQHVQDHPVVQMVSPDIMAALPSVSQSLMMSVASLAAMPLVARLAQKFNHSVEHLADMKAAALTSAQETVDFFTERGLKEEAEGLAAAKEMKAYMMAQKEHILDFSLVKAWQDAMASLRAPLYDTHPRASTRMEFIAKAYGLTTPTPEIAALEKPVLAAKSASAGADPLL